MEDEKIDPLMFTKEKLQDQAVTKQMIDRQYQEQPVQYTVDRELIRQIGDAIHNLTEIRRELHEVYKKLHHPYYGQEP